MCDLFLTALPKTGTHLMRQLLNTEPFPDTLVPLEEQDVISATCLNEYKDRFMLSAEGRRHQHIPFLPRRAEKLKDAVGFMVVRDPRDVIVSHAHYVDVLPDETWINYWVDKKHRLSDLPFGGRIDFLIRVMRARLVAYNGWAYQENVHVFSYKRLVTNREKQVARLMEILGELCDASYSEMLHRAEPTAQGAFRRGKVGDYKHAFSNAQKIRARQEFGDFIEVWE